MKIFHYFCASLELNIMLKKTLSHIITLFVCFCVDAQDIYTHRDQLKNSPSLKITGYLQPELQIGEQSALLDVGAPNAIDDQGATFNRVGLRRGRIKFVYDDGRLGAATLQFNVIDKPGIKGAQVQFKDLYFKLKAPWNMSSLLQVGMFGRPFGYEINHSSSSRESPERSRIINSLFPGRSDLGAMIVLQPGVESPFHFISLRGGLFAGNGINPETDNRKDFIGKLKVATSMGDKVDIGMGISYYNGGVFQSNDSVYTMNNSSFTLDVNANHKGNYAKREYIGVDAQFKYRSMIGLTQLRGEYIVGTQPGTAIDTESPDRAFLPSHENTFIRPFTGGYLMLVQHIGQSPFSAVLKYESFDPNAAVSGNSIGIIGSNTSGADIQYQVMGVGLNWQVAPHVRATLYYDKVTNESASLLSSADYRQDYSSDRKDNVFTFRIQYKF